MSVAIAFAAALAAGCASGDPTTGDDVPDQTALEGRFESSEQGTPHLVFEAAGTYTGSDGCNTLGGRIEPQDDRFVLEPMTSTLKACLGVDDWLRYAKAVQVDGDTLVVLDKAGEEIGTLTRS